MIDYSKYFDERKFDERKRKKNVPKKTLESMVESLAFFAISLFFPFLWGSSFQRCSAIQPLFAVSSKSDDQ
jgi:hypothetical protein